MNQPEARKSREGIEGELYGDAEILEVFRNPCITARIRDEHDGRAKESHAPPSPNYQPGVSMVHGSGSCGPNRALPYGA